MTDVKNPKPIDPAKSYDPRAFPAVGVTVDIVIQTIADAELQVVLIERDQWPFEGRWALPGGFVQEEENLDEAAARELAEETSVQDTAKFLEQIGAYGDPGRDPRPDIRIVTVAYLGIIPN